MAYVRIIASLLTIFSCSGCTGYILVPENAVTKVDSPNRTDGAVVGYYLPKATWKFTAAYDQSTGLITLTSDAKPTVVPDTDSKLHLLSYAHSQLSDDDMDIMFDGMMLKSIASKSSDQTVKIVEAANALITQAGSTAKAVDARIADVGGSTPAPKRPDELTTAQCTTNLKSEIVINLSNGSRGLQNNLLWGKDCGLIITPVVNLRSPLPKAQGIQLSSSQHLDQSVDDRCALAICFRPTGSVIVAVTVQLGTTVHATTDQPIGKTNLYPIQMARAGAPDKVPMKFSQNFGPVNVPIDTPHLAYVEFSRRVFVENHTTLAFTDGILTEFHSTDPSVIAGAVTLGSDLLKSVALTVPLVR